MPNAEGTIASIAKQPGDAVAVDEVLFQIETDKVTMDVRAPESGTIESILVRACMGPGESFRACNNGDHRSCRQLPHITAGKGGRHSDSRPSACKDHGWRGGTSQSRGAGCGG